MVLNGIIRKDNNLIYYSIGLGQKKIQFMQKVKNTSFSISFIIGQIRASYSGIFICLMILILLGLFGSCKQETKKAKIELPAFNADSAFHFIQKQVDLGPRVPNTASHQECASYLEQKLNQYNASVIIQEADLEAYDGTILQAKNIIAQFNKNNPNRILLCAHWDSRQVADHCEFPDRRDEPIPGANDGASGVGILLEIARQISSNPPKLGIDIIFFDAEDHGIPDHLDIEYKADTWCLGSQYWAKNPHIKNYYARYGILLDMVGAKNAIFTQEGLSVHHAPEVIEKVWNNAAKLGYGNYFYFDDTKEILDDHYYINNLAVKASQKQKPKIDFGYESLYKE